MKNKIDETEKEKNSPIRLQAFLKYIVGFIKRKKYILGIATVLVSVLLDILIRTTEFSYFIVSNDYISCMFSALCTVAVLGNAILSIVVGAFSEKIYGFRLKEILVLSTCPIKLSRTVSIAFGSLVLAIVFFTIGFCTTVTAITIVIVIEMGCSSYCIWKVLTDENTAKDFLFKSIDYSNAATVTTFLQHWYEELCVALKGQATTTQNEYIELISRTFSEIKNNKMDLSVFLETELGKTFPVACVSLGFVDAYKRVLCFESSEKDYIIDTVGIAKKYINQISYIDTQTIAQYRIAATIEDIVERMSLDEQEITTFAYWFFEAIKNNCTISEITKKEILNDSINKLCYLRDRTEKCVRGDVLLLILKYDVLENDNKIERENIFLLLLNNLFHENRYNYDKAYISILAQTFRAIYFVSIKESETLTPTHRNEIKQLFHLSKKTKAQLCISLNQLLKENEKQIIDWLISDIKQGYEHGFCRSLFDYSPANFFCKTAIWIDKALMKFAFEYYAIVGYSFSLFPATVIINDTELPVRIRERICESILELYDGATGQFTDFVKAETIELKNCIDESSQISERDLLDNFEFFNDALGRIKMEKMLPSVKEYNSTDEINSILPKYLEDISGFIYDPTLKYDNCVNVNVSPLLSHVEKDTISAAISSKKSEIKIIIASIIEDVLPSVGISFGSIGVKELLSKLSEKQYIYRNYTYIDDWAIKSDVRASEDFEMLAKKIQSIPLDKNCKLNSRVFLTVENIRFNATVTAFELRKPTYEEANQYIERYKLAEGKYRIDGVVRNMEQSIVWIRSVYNVQTSSLKVATNIDKDSGFKVKFSRTTD